MLTRTYARTNTHTRTDAHSYTHTLAALQPSACCHGELCVALTMAASPHLPRPALTHTHTNTHTHTFEWFL